MKLMRVEIHIPFPDYVCAEHFDCVEFLYSSAVRFNGIANDHTNRIYYFKIKLALDPKRYHELYQM